MATFSILDKFPHFLEQVVERECYGDLLAVGLVQWPTSERSGGTRPCCSVDADVFNFVLRLAKRQLGKSIGEWLNAHSGTVRCDGSDGGKEWTCKVEK